MNNKKASNRPPGSMGSLEVPIGPLKAPLVPLNMPLDPVGSLISPVVSYKSSKGPLKMCLLIYCAVKHSWRKKEQALFLGLNKRKSKVLEKSIFLDLKLISRARTGGCGGGGRLQIQGHSTHGNTHGQQYNKYIVPFMEIIKWKQIHII